METMKEKEITLEERLKSTIKEELKRMLTAKSRFFMWVDEETGNVRTNYEADANNLSTTVMFSIEVVRTAIRKNITPLAFLSETPPFDQVITPSAISALKAAMDELDKCEINAVRAVQEAIENEANGK